MHPGISKPKEVSTNVDTSEDISSSSDEMSSKSTHTWSATLRSCQAFAVKLPASRRSRIQVPRVLSM